MSARRVAVVAGEADRALHGLDGGFAWGEGRSFGEEQVEDLRAWQPDTVIGIGVLAPPGPWRAIGWGAPIPRSVGVAGTWRRAPLPAADALGALRSRPGSGVLVVGGEDAERRSVLDTLCARNVDARAVPRLDCEGLERAAVVVLVGPPGAPLPDAAPAVLAAGRLLVAPRAEPGFGLMPGSDHLSYDNEYGLLWCADVAYSFPQAFEPLVAMASLAVEPHLASVVYGRLGVDAELEERQSSSAMRGAAR